MRIFRADGRRVGPLLVVLAAALLAFAVAEEDWQSERFTGDDVDSFFDRTASNRRVLLIGPATRREDNVVAASVRRPSEQNRPQPLASPFPQHLRPIVLIKNKGHPPPPTDNRPVAEVNAQPFSNAGLFHVQPDVREFQQEQQEFPDRNRFFSQNGRQQEFERPQQPSRFNQEVPIASNSGFRGNQRPQAFQREEEEERRGNREQFRSFPSTSNRNQFLDQPTHDPRSSLISMPPTTFDPQVDLRSNTRPQQIRTHLQEVNSGRLSSTDQQRGRFRFTEEDAVPPHSTMRQTQRPAPPPTTQTVTNTHPPTVSKDLDEFFGNQNLVPTTPAVTPGKSQTWPSAAFPPTTPRPRPPFLSASKAVSPSLVVENRFPQTTRPLSTMDDDRRFGAVEEDEDQAEEGGDIAESPNHFKGLTGINPQFVDFSTLTTKAGRRPSSTPSPTIRVNPTPKTRTVIPSPPSKRPTQSIRTSAPSLPQRVTVSFRDSITPPSNRIPLRSTFRPRTTTEAIEPIDHIIQFKDIPRTGTRPSVRKTSVRKSLIRNSSPSTKTSIGRTSSTIAPSTKLSVNRFNNDNSKARRPTTTMTRDDEIFSKEEDPNGSFPVQLDPSRSRVFIPPRTTGRGPSLSNTLSPLSPDGAVPVSQEDEEEYDDNEDEDESTTALTTPRSLPVTARATWRSQTRPSTRTRTLSSSSRTTQLASRQRPLVSSTLRNQGRFMQRPPSTTMDYLDIQPAPEVDNFQEEPSPPSHFRKPRPHLPRAPTQPTHPTIGEEDFPDSNVYDESLEESDEEYDDFSTTPATTFRPTRPKRPTRRRPSISTTTQRPKVRVSTKSSMGRVETKPSSGSSSTSRNSKTKCDPRYCQLPYCNCGGPTIPGGFTAEEIPQIVLLTFDDAVNDLNWPLYQTLFFQDRTNPNGCPILTTLYVSHEWTDYGKVQSMYAAGHEIASHSISHGDGASFSKQKWHDEIYGQKEILSRYGGVKMEDIRGMRAPFLQIGGNKMFGMLHEDNFTYDSSVTVLENNPPVWPYTFDYGMPHSCAIPPCPTSSFPGLWEIPMVSLTDTNGGRCSMADSCSYDTTSEGVYKMLMKNFDRHYNSNRAPLGLYYHSSWFLIPHRKEGFIKFLEEVMQRDDVYFITAYQLIQWMRNPTPLSRIKDFGPWQCYKNERPEACRRSRECNIPFRGDTRLFRTCGECPSIYPWVGKTNV